MPETPDLKRVLNLPRREPPDLSGTTGHALVELMTSRLRRDNPQCKCASWGRPCVTRLLPVQAWALYEAPLAGGLLAPISVGAGKTGLDILVASVMPRCRLAVLLVPPALREQLVRDYLAWAEHFNVPSLVDGDRGYIYPGRPVIHVVPYSQLSRAEATNLLERLRPDLVIADEAHRLRHRETSTTGRVLRYWVAHPETRLCCWSGTLTSRSLRDYAHLAALALGDGSPLPHDPGAVDAWASAVDASDAPAPPGALSKLGVGPARDVFRRRLAETRGVVMVSASGAACSLNLLERRAPRVPASIAKMLADLRAGWVRPDGEELVDRLSVARSARELACGFYYRWVFPGEPDPALVARWFAARKAWHRELRRKLSDRVEHLDSPLLCAKAAVRAYQRPAYTGDLPTWRALAWPEWRDVRDLVPHETEAVWVSDYLLRDAADWASERPGVIWYEHDAAGRRLSELAGIPCYGGGDMAEAALTSERGDRSIVCSLRAHGTGRDGLQRLYSRQLVLTPPAGGAAWEQMLGRLHRVGQAADEVETCIYRHVPELAEALVTAIRDAVYVRDTTGAPQKLLLATMGFDLTTGVDGLP